MKKEKYDLVRDGEWFEVSSINGEIVACCDCGLVHRVKISKRDNKLGLRMWRLPSRTGGIRAGMTRAQQQGGE